MSNSKVLLVDADHVSAHDIERALNIQKYEVQLVASGEEALDKLESQSFDLAILAVALPGISGIETCREIRRSMYFSRMPVVIMGDGNNRQIRIDSRRVGCDGFYAKPVDSEELMAGIHNLLVARHHNQVLDRDRLSLRRALDDQAGLLGQAMFEIGTAKKTVQAFNEEIVFRLSKAVEFRDDETGNHVQRMSRYASLISKKLGMNEETCDNIRIASALHDVGKISIPDEILHKPGKLTDDEMKVMRRHAGTGQRLLLGSKSNLLELGANIAGTHHEKCDGSGYPRGIPGKDIPIEGRISAVADIFDALTSKRVYKPPMSIEKASKILNSERGVQLDAQIVDIFLGSMKEIKNIMIVYSDR